jgi:hypothetical protein
MGYVRPPFCNMTTRHFPHRIPGFQSINYSKIPITSHNLIPNQRQQPTILFIYLKTMSINFYSDMLANHANFIATQTHLRDPTFVAKSKEEILQLHSKDIEEYCYQMNAAFFGRKCDANLRLNAQKRIKELLVNNGYEAAYHENKRNYRSAMLYYSLLFYFEDFMT